MGQRALEVARRMSVATHVERLESILRDAASARAASATRCSMTHWTILTCEYPPGCGGVGDYTAQVAAALAEAGDTVTVFCPPRAAPAPRDLGDFVEPPGVEVVMLDDVYGSIGRRTIDQRLGDQRLARSSVDDSGPVRSHRFRPSRSEHSVVPLAARASPATRRRRARDVSRTLLRVHLEPHSAECACRRRATDGEDAAARGLARLPLDRGLAPISRASYSGSAPQGLVTLPIPSAIPRCDRPADVAERRGLLLGSSATSSSATSARSGRRWGRCSLLS